MSRRSRGKSASKWSSQCSSMTAGRLGFITWPCNKMSLVAMHMLLAYALQASRITK